MNILKSKNIGRFDQIIRVCVSLILIYYGFFDNSAIIDEFSGMLAGILGVLNLLIAFVRFCPMYVFTGINTACKKNSA